MGRMVGGDHLDRTVRDARDQRGAVFAAAQRRIHLEASVLLQILVAEQQIMRRRFAAHTHAAGLRTPYQLDALLGRDVADVILATGLFGQRDVAFHLLPLALGADALVPVRTAVFAVVDIAAPQQVVHLAVGHDRPAGFCRPAHRLLHQFVGLHAAAVV